MRDRILDDNSATPESGEEEGAVEFERFSGEDDGTCQLLMCVRKDPALGGTKPIASRASDGFLIVSLNDRLSNSALRRFRKSRVYVKGPHLSLINFLSSQFLILAAEKGTIFRAIQAFTDGISHCAASISNPGPT